MRDTLTRDVFKLKVQYAGGREEGVCLDQAHFFFQVKLMSTYNGRHTLSSPKGGAKKEEMAPCKGMRLYWKEHQTGVEDATKNNAAHAMLPDLHSPVQSHLCCSHHYQAEASSLNLTRRQ